MLRSTFSPTNDMHINDMRIALINYIISRQKKEQFIARIEDTDKARNIEGKDQEILDLLKKFAIEQDQLFYQSDNLGRHQQFALSLIGQGKAFTCLCSPTELESDYCSEKCLQHQETIAVRIKSENLPYIIRIKKPEETITFTDKIKGIINTEPNEVGNFTILGADGNPTYDFASACDDMLTGISLVIRDEGHTHSTPRQIHIKHSLGYSADTEYAHLPSLLNPTDKNDNITIKWMLSEGFLLDTIINFLLLVGNETPTEVFTLPEAIKWFTLENISKNPIQMDMDKLRYLNRKHLETMEDITLSRIFGFADADIGKLLKLHLQEASTINELDAKIKAIFSPKACQEEWNDEMVAIATVIQQAPMINHFDDFAQHIMKETGLKEESLSTPLRLLMTGAHSGPELGAVYALTKPYITEIARYTSC